MNLTPVKQLVIVRKNGRYESSPGIKVQKRMGVGVYEVTLPETYDATKLNFMVSPMPEHKPRMAFLRRVEAHSFEVVVVSRRMKKIVESDFVLQAFAP